jgi:hypothetical protein
VGVGDIESVHVWPVEAVTVYPSTGSPPFGVAAVQPTVALSFVTTALTPVGALGALDVVDGLINSV